MPPTSILQPPTSLPQRALTLFPVFAELIAAGAKRLENRPKPTKIRGPVAIHASTRSHYNGESINVWAKLHSVDESMLKPGHIVAVVDILDCLHITQIAKQLDTGDLSPDQSTHAIGPWCYVLGNPRRIEPVRAVGQLGFWTIRASKPDMTTQLESA